MTTSVFQASDLAGAKRREFLDVARLHGALLRDTDGFALTMLPLEQFEALAEVASVAVSALIAESVIARGVPRPAELGALSWLAAFETDDFPEFFAELRDALAISVSARDATPVNRCLREWRTTAHALSDPLRREILIGAGTDEFIEVGRPEE